MEEVWARRQKALATVFWLRIRTNGKMMSAHHRGEDEGFQFAFAANDDWGSWFQAEGP